MQRPYEQLSILFNTVVMMSSNQYTPLGRRLRPRVFYGPCQIMTKTDYDTIGGHEQVRSTVLEDIAIGKRFLDEGIPIRSIAGRGAISFRMYPEGISDIVQGWSKNFATGAASIGVFNTILVSLWLTGMIGIGILSWFYLGSQALLFAGLYLLYGVQLYWIGRRIGSFSIGLILFHPMVGIFFTLVFLNSIHKTVFRRNVQWKGRDIPTKEET
jgi:4,4'-diaponeurosporenoate glycosyltransferase